jgi:hypothetical protein
MIFIIDLKRLGIKKPQRKQIILLNVYVIKKMSRYKEKLIKIKEYYTQALLAIKAGDIKLATKIIYHDLGTPLYDVALDIIYADNEYKNDLEPETEKLWKELSKLINKVDNVLCKDDKNDVIKDKGKIEVNSTDDKWFTDNKV